MIHNLFIVVIVICFSVFVVTYGELSTNDEVTTQSVKNSRYGSSRRTRNKDRHAFDIQNVYKMSVDDMRAFFEKVYDEAMECEVGEYYSFDLRTCRSCEGICRSVKKEMMKRCEKLCPVDFLRMNDISGQQQFSILVITIASFSLFLSIVAIAQQLLRRKVISMKAASAITHESDLDSTEEIIEFPTPETARKVNNEESFLGLQIPETANTYGEDCSLAVENKHPIPSKLRS